MGQSRTGGSGPSGPGLNEQKRFKKTEKAPQSRFNASPAHTQMLYRLPGNPTPVRNVCGFGMGGSGGARGKRASLRPPVVHYMCLAKVRERGVRKWRAGVKRL